MVVQDLLAVHYMTLLDSMTVFFWSLDYYTDVERKAWEASRIFSGLRIARQFNAE